MIYETIIPETGTLNQNIDIYLSAGAPNGCYSDLEIELVEIDNRHFLFKATGMLSDGPCPMMLIGKDTTIAFTPVLSGDYFFQTNEHPLEIKRDTLHVY